MWTHSHKNKTFRKVVFIMYDKKMKIANQMFKKYQLPYEMRKVCDRYYGHVYKLYLLPEAGRAQCICSSPGSGELMDGFRTYNGPDNRIRYMVRDYLVAVDAAARGTGSI